MSIRMILSICSLSVLGLAKNQTVELKTSKGSITLELNTKKAPKTVENFISYVKSKHYDGTIFHRVIDGFMIQGGGFDKDMNEKKTQAPIKNEANNGLGNDKYTIAMARTNDPNSATAQFFINVTDNTNLNYSVVNPGYAVFGKVTKGQEVVDAIKSVQTGNKNVRGNIFENVPIEAVTIESIRLIK